MTDNPKRTFLYDWHLKNQANMANFGGYEMPLWYKTGVKTEHLAVLTHAGIFDTSHMSVVQIKGKDAFDLLQLCFTKDLRYCIGVNKKPITAGRCVYGAYLNQKGWAIDDAIVYQIGKENYLTVVNAGMGDKIADHLTNHKKHRQVDIISLSDKLGKLDVQGRLSAKIISKIISSPSKAFANLSYFSFKGHFDEYEPSSKDVCLIDGTPMLLSRTGYTGEFGFEIFIQPQHFVKLWDMLQEAGKEFNLITCGLAARDSLRGGAVLPLSHQDIGNWHFINNPWPFSLPYNDDQTDFTKDFIGSQALKEIEDSEFTYPFIGFDLRKVETPAIVLDNQEREIGIVLTCVTDMGIGWGEDDKIYSIVSPNKPKDFNPKGLCCGFIKVTNMLKIGQPIVLKDKRRAIEAIITQDIRPDRTARCSIQSML